MVRQAFPDLRGEILRLATGQDTVAAEITVRGTHKGPLQTATGGLVPASDRAIEFYASLWIRICDGRIAREGERVRPYRGGNSARGCDQSLLGGGDAAQGVRAGRPIP